MTKNKIRYFCTECGQESPRWMGRCPGCDSWNCLVEEKVAKAPSHGKESGAHRIAATLKKQEAGVPGVRGAATLRPVTVDEAEDANEERRSTGLNELDRVLGGGIVPGSLTLVGGDPGIGKSTLMLQAAAQVAQSWGPVLYISGEESVGQVKLRAKRLAVQGNNLLLMAATDIDAVVEAIVGVRPVWVIVDSIQTIYWPELGGAPGSVSQVRECAAQLLRLAKELPVAISIIGHVTKEGAIAGPRVLEHMVDAVLYLEGERHYPYRVLRAVKNRFGSTNELGVFEMGGDGLNQVPNPSSLFLGEREEPTSGSVVAPLIEGSRPVLVEIQALVTPSSFGQARRMATGLDYNRMILLAAVLDKKVGLNLVQQDIYVNVAGGFKVIEPAADLAVVTAIASSHRSQKTDGKTVVIGEVGLTGEVRPVGHLERRVKEAAKLGFHRCVFPKANRKALEASLDMELVAVETVDEALAMALGG